MTTSSPTAQLAFLMLLTVHLPFFSLARSVSPAQFGQSKSSPLEIPAGISISCPHPWHHAFGTPSSLNRSGWFCSQGNCDYKGDPEQYQAGIAEEIGVLMRHGAHNLGCQGGRPPDHSEHER